MGELAESYHDMKQAKQDSHWKHSKEELTWLNRTLKSFSFNQATGQAVIDTEQGKIDYWTTTSRWFERKSHRYGRGYRSFIKLLKDRGGLDD
ncbi:hypothetical protein [Loigolactobacillus coryniformis]|uniref:hypothetical protein n=1 Tax=Loigolactobacillus coryniformis TaxID=1610 RepID=UPI00055100FD|nr:hypothetical protein [Loigolactobacillus coryniformis]